MVFLLNSIPTIIFLVGMLTSYHYIKRGEVIRIVVTLMITLSTLWLYSQIQPSYIPKHGVKALPTLPLEVDNSLEIKDTLRKPTMTEKQRNDHFNNEVLTYDEDIKKILNNN